MGLRYWIDIFNGPHVHFFQSIDKYVNRTILTARNYKPIPELLNLYDVPATLIGEHGGKDIYQKLLTSSQRIIELANFMKNKSVDVVLHKHSVEAARVAWGYAIPSISFIDNELMVPQNMLVCPLSNVLIAPIAISQYVLRNFTPSHVGILQFNGVAEVANVSDFIPDEQVLERFDLNINKPIIVIRGEPILAAYNHGSSLVDALLNKIRSDVPDAQIIRLNRAGEKMTTDHPVVDARSLCYFSNLVISGGGTLTREAALLGTRAITFFNKPLAVDRYLIHKKILESYPGKKILDLNFSKELRQNTKRPRYEDFEHPFSLIPKAEKLLNLKINGEH